MHQFLKFILFWNDTLHVSDGLSIHHRVQDCTYSNRYMSNRYHYMLASGNNMHLVGFTAEMYYDAQPYECQN